MMPLGNIPKRYIVQAVGLSWKPRLRGRSGLVVMTTTTTTTAKKLVRKELLRRGVQNPGPGPGVEPVEEEATEKKIKPGGNAQT